MRPDNQRPSTPVNIPSRPLLRDDGSRLGHQRAAANLVRGQIDTIYQNDPNHTIEASKLGDEDHAKAPSEKAISPHSSAMSPGPGAINLQLTRQESTATETAQDHTHSSRAHNSDDGEWKKYHSAWQNYYQQYYERYYIGQVHATRQELERQAKVQERTYTAEQGISTDEAMYDLRSKLRSRITERAKKVRKSRHFVPVLAACVVMVAFLFLQYNRVVFAAVDAYVAPGSLTPESLIVDPNVAGSVSVEPKLIIPKISVDVPIIWNANASSQESLNAAMDNGVAWFNIHGANARPGEVGNFVLSGHSSNDWLDGGNYKFIFARLEQMAVGDTIYVNYNSQRYVYTITHTEVVTPTNVAALTKPTDKPMMTLVTCTPLGTATNRLLVFAEQVSPSPTTATTSQEPSTATDAQKIPSNSPTFLQRLFGAGN
ncbi:MAG: sortase [Candidatus Saccharimonas sp.]